MANITLNANNKAMTRIEVAIKGTYPIPLDGNGDPLFTDNEWAVEVVRLYVIDVVAKYEQKVARDAITFNPEATL